LLVGNMFLHYYFEYFYYSELDKCDNDVDNRKYNETGGEAQKRHFLL
jgi:hypothetical protein